MICKTHQLRCVFQSLNVCLFTNYLNCFKFYPFSLNNQDKLIFSQKKTFMNCQMICLRQLKLDQKNHRVKCLTLHHLKKNPENQFRILLSGTKRSSHRKSLKMKKNKTLLYCLLLHRINMFNSSKLPIINLNMIYYIVLIFKVVVDILYNKLLTVKL